MKNNFKKIIASTYLFAILFGLFLPFNYSFGQSPSNRLVISAEKLNIKAEESVLISAKTYNLGNKLVIFKISPNQGLSIGSCTTGEVGSDYISSCQTTLKTTKDANGTFIITASTNYNGTLNSANKIELKIEKGLTTIVCKEPQILNEKKDACITPPVTTPPNTLPGGNNAGTSSTAKDTDVIYEPLAPLPGDGGVLQKEINTQEDCAFGKYLNIIIKLIIGISAVLAMVMITMGGIEYMTSELVSEKSAGKDTIQNAILGLLIALGSYLILNTINPQLLNVCLDKLPTAEITIIENFEASGALTFDGTPIKVNFNKEAYPSAKIAEQKTGVSKSLILAIFAQETNNGANTGGCNYTNANMSPGELIALKEITSDWATVKMSCSGGGSSHGGAIGLTQFLPSTWKQFRGEAEKLLGHRPNAWNIGDALMMTALKLKSNNGIKDPEGAACKYFGSCNVTISCGNNKKGTYGQCVMGKKLSIEQQISDAIKKGEITP
ncbi:MAG: lytic murein transglycosylase [Burkholderiales bacterium]|nr:lytic murein transglycosylase [Burkholderiales bacterium]